jgi:hypothetical protein
MTIDEEDAFDEENSTNIKSRKIKKSRDVSSDDVFDFNGYESNRIKRRVLGYVPKQD